tara:strand:- start:1702 stop:6375 length:4674 start_codon:yes stop_codon:yes gene_type:complete
MELLREIDTNFCIDTNPNNFAYTKEQGGEICLFDIEDVQNGNGAWELIEAEYSNIEPFDNPIDNDNYEILGIGEASQGGVFLDKRDGSVLKLTASPFEVLGTHKVMEAQKRSDDYLVNFPKIYGIKNVGKLDLVKGVHTKFPSQNNYFAIRRADIVPFEDDRRLSEKLAFPTNPNTYYIDCMITTICQYYIIVEDKNGYWGDILINNDIEKPIEVLGEVLKNPNKYIRSSFEDGGKLEAKGDCYFASGNLVMRDFLNEIDYIGTPYLVHAEVQGQGALSNIRYGHSWIEDDFMVYDYSNNRKLAIDKNLYYKLGDVKTDNPKKYQKYTFDQARRKMVESGHYGCWDLDVEYKEGGKVMDVETKEQGGIVSGKTLKEYIENSNYGNDLSFVQYINDNDKFELKNIDINAQIQKDATLKDFIQHDTEKYQPNENERKWLDKEPIIIGDSSYETDVVLDGYHRIKQAKANKEKTILAYVKASNYADGGKVNSQNFDGYMITKFEAPLKYNYEKDWKVEIINPYSHYYRKRSGKRELDAYLNPSNRYDLKWDLVWSMVNEYGGKWVFESEKANPSDVLKQVVIIETTYMRAKGGNIPMNIKFFDSKGEVKEEKDMVEKITFGNDPFADTRVRKQTLEEIREEMLKSKNPIQRELADETAPFIYGLQGLNDEERARYMGYEDLAEQLREEQKQDAEWEETRKNFKEYFYKEYNGMQVDSVEFAGVVDIDGKNKKIKRIYDDKVFRPSKAKLKALEQEIFEENFKKGGYVSWKDKYNKKYGYKKGESHSLKEISKDTKVSMKGLQKIYNKGVGARKTNPQSVRSVSDGKKRGGKSLKGKMSAEQWAMARVYSAVMGGKASKVDAKELKMAKGGDIKFDVVEMARQFDVVDNDGTKYEGEVIKPLSKSEKNKIIKAIKNIAENVDGRFSDIVVDDFTNEEIYANLKFDNDVYVNSPQDIILDRKTFELINSDYADHRYLYESGYEYAKGGHINNFFYDYANGGDVKNKMIFTPQEIEDLNGTLALDSINTILKKFEKEIKNYGINVETAPLSDGEIKEITTNSQIKTPPKKALKHIQGFLNDLGVKTYLKYKGVGITRRPYLQLDSNELVEFNSNYAKGGSMPSKSSCYKKQTKYKDGGMIFTFDEGGEISDTCYVKYAGYQIQNTRCKDEGIDFFLVGEYREVAKMLRENYPSEWIYYNRLSRLFVKPSTAKEFVREASNYFNPKVPIEPYFLEVDRSFATYINTLSIPFEDIPISTSVGRSEKPKIDLKDKIKARKEDKQRQEKEKRMLEQEKPFFKTEDFVKSNGVYWAIALVVNIGGKGDFGDNLWKNSILNENIPYDNGISVMTLVHEYAHCLDYNQSIAQGRVYKRPIYELELLSGRNSIGEPFTQDELKKMRLAQQQGGERSTLLSNHKEYFVKALSDILRAGMSGNISILNRIEDEAHQIEKRVGGEAYAEQQRQDAKNEFLLAMQKTIEKANKVNLGVQIPTKFKEFLKNTNSAFIVELPITEIDKKIAIQLKPHLDVYKNIVKENMAYNPSQNAKLLNELRKLEKDIKRLQERT